MSRPGPASPHGRNTSLLVVHGVGVEHAGASMVQLAESLVAHEGLPATLEVERFALEDLPLGRDGESKVPVFSAPTLKISAPGAPLRFVELYWGDLSQAKESLAGVVVGAFRLILGLRFVLIPLRREPGMGALPWLCNLLLLLLRGPILGGSIFGISLVLWSSILWAVGKKAYDPQRLEQVSWPVLASCCLLATLLLLGLRRFTSPTSGLRSWTGGWALFATAVAAVGFGIGAGLGDTGIAKALLAVIHGLRGLWTLVNLLSLGCLATTILLYLRAPKPTRPSLLACFAVTQLSLGFWAIVVPLVILAADGFVPDFAKFEGWADLRRDALPTVGIVWTGFLALLLAALGTFLARLRWSSRHEHLPPSSPARPPRLILGSAIVAVFLLAPLWLLSAFFITIRRGPGSQLLATLNGIAIATAPFVLAALGSRLPVLRLLLSIALDAVSYFKPDAAEARKLWPGAEPKGELRQGVSHRFRAILEPLLAEQGTGSRLIVLAHSQGTMLAIDVLGDPGHRELLSRFSEVHLLTMGSPFTHLYQTYFPATFANRHEDGDSVPLASWTNLYRFDDYVGTHIAGEVRLGTARPENIGLGFGGHTGYFGDRRVVAEVAGLALSSRALPVERVQR